MLAWRLHLAVNELAEFEAAHSSRYENKSSEIVEDDGEFFNLATINGLAPFKSAATPDKCTFTVEKYTKQVGHSNFTFEVSK